MISLAQTYAVIENQVSTGAKGKEEISKENSTVKRKSSTAHVPVKRVKREDVEEEEEIEKSLLFLEVDEGRTSIYYFHCN